MVRDYQLLPIEKHRKKQEAGPGKDFDLLFDVLRVFSVEQMFSRRIVKSIDNPDRQDSL